ncbi:MAG: uncharacterized protein A8A55_1921 [Amphiamblys sp. WSBS2006]|nr:MAG: uncharacterized protein A8A55_1921 [Amphiamblys sp. WSBS2006]
MARTRNHPKRMRSRGESLSKSSEDGPKKKEVSLSKTARDSEKNPRAKRDDTTKLEGIGYSCLMVGDGRGCLSDKAAALKRLWRLCSSAWRESSTDNRDTRMF